MSSSLWSERHQASRIRLHDQLGARRDVRSQEAGPMGVCPWGRRCLGKINRARVPTCSISSHCFRVVHRQDRALTRR